MSFLTGKTSTQSNVIPESSAALKQLLAYLTGGQGLERLFPGTEVDNKSIQPYLDLFSQQNSRNFAQAKESAGNLTGSGLGNIIGSEAARANADQGAFLANLFEARRQNDASRFAQLLLGALGSPAGGVTTTYTPGLLDYAAQGASALASGGAFNSFFKK